MAGFIDSDDEYLDRMGGTPDGDLQIADGYRQASEDWAGELARQQEADGRRMAQERDAAMAQRADAQRNVLDGYVRYGLDKIEQGRQAQDMWGDHVAAAMLLAARNNGQVPQYMFPGMNAARGLDGKTATIYGGGYTKGGTGFVLAAAKKDPQTGQLVPDRDASVMLDTRGMYDIMYNRPVMFSRQQLQGVHDMLAKQVADRSSGQEKLPDIPSNWGEIGNGANGGKTAASWSWLNPRERSGISAFGSNGRGGFTQYESDEGTGYQLQSRDFGTRERTWDGMSERERIARINADSREKQAQTNADARIAAAEARGAGRVAGEKVPRGTSAGGEQDKFNDKIFSSFDTEREAILNGREYSELSDDEKRRHDDVLRRQAEYRDRFINGQRDAEKPVPPPQQRLVYYRDSQGNLKSGNGYVQGGRVYGADGRLIEGARETDRNGMTAEDALRARGIDPKTGKKVASGGRLASAASGTGENPAAGENAKEAKSEGGGAPVLKQGMQGGASTASLEESSLSEPSNGGSVAERKKRLQEQKDEQAAEMQRRYADVFDDVRKRAEEGARRSVENDRKTVGADKGVKYEDAYRTIFANLARDKINNLSKEDLERLEKVSPGEAFSGRINLRQSLYDLYGIDIYDETGIGGMLTGDGGTSSRTWYEDLVDKTGARKKGSWRRGGKSSEDWGSSISVGGRRAK